MSAVAERRLYLLRHAKSSWKDERLADHERPLARRGRRAAKAIGRHLREQGVDPELVLCSTARRARETLEGLEPSLGRGAIRVEPGCTARVLPSSSHASTRFRASVRSVMVIGHNPALEQLALLLARRGSTVQELETKFPTGALATLACRGPGWAALDHGTADLIEFIRPRDLE